MPNHTQLERSQAALVPDAMKEQMLHGDVTLGDAGVVSAITVPDWARWFRITNGAVGEIYHAVNEAPEAPAAVSGESIAYSSFSVGNSVALEGVDTRIIQARTDRTLQLMSDTNAATCRVEFGG